MDDLFERIAALGDSIEGITLSGGEPLQQWQPAIALLKRIKRETGFSTLVFTGYTRMEIQRMPGSHRLADYVDVLIAGRYHQSRHIPHSLLGSENQTVHLLTDRYTIEDLRTVPGAELLICPDGKIISSGIDPIL